MIFDGMKMLPLGPATVVAADGREFQCETVDSMRYLLPRNIHQSLDPIGDFDRYTAQGLKLNLLTGDYS